MPQSLSKIYIHLVFHVKYNSVTILENDLPQLFAYIDGIILNNKGCVIQIGGIPEKHSTSPVSHGRPPLTVTPAPWTPSPLCPLIPHGCPPLTDPDTPWTPSPHCPLIPSGRPSLSVPRHPVDALPSMSPDALWTPSPHCSLMPCGRSPLSVP